MLEVARDAFVVQYFWKRALQVVDPSSVQNFACKKFNVEGFSLHWSQLENFFKRYISSVNIALKHF